MGPNIRTYTYPAIFEPGDVVAFVVSFSDVPGAITQGDDDADARAMAADALGLCLLTYVEQGKPLPQASAGRPDQVLITVDADVAAKLAVLEAFRESDITEGELAGRLGKDAREVRRILDPHHATKIATLAEALSVLGRRLVVGVEAA